MQTALQKLQDFLQQLFRADAADLMDAFIISATDFTKLRPRYPNMNKQDFEAWHILFPNSDDLTYLSPIFEEASPGEQVDGTPAGKVS